MRIIAILYLVSAVVSALIILSDVIKHPQSMRIMNSVWILSALWGGPVILWAYFSFGRAVKPAMNMDMDMNMPSMEMDHGMGQNDMSHGMQGMMDMKMRPKWESVVVSTLHCGAGCTLADIIGETFTLLIPIAIGGSIIAGTWTFEFLLALVIGILFQYAAIRSMQKIPKAEAVEKAAKADILSLSSWQIGMYAWMALSLFVFSVERYSWEYWFMMQIAMFVGFAAALPVNVLLIKYGIKKSM